MRYMGSKRMIAKEIIPLILQEKHKWYVEPFCGGLNTLSELKNESKIFMSDNNLFLIEMWKGLQKK